MDGAAYSLTRWLFQRGLGLMYLMAFLGVVNQFRPLLGERGLLPVPRFIRLVPFRSSPSLFHRFPTDTAFALCGWLGVGLSLLAMTGLAERFGTAAAMALWLFLYLLYLSFVNVGQIFYGFGWESLLLETGFLALFLGGAQTEPPLVTIFLLRWVLFRVMFGAGLIKLRGDPCWRDLTCLDYHFETQPMPNPLSWYFYWLPAGWHRTGVLFNHLAELAIPFLYFAPQPIAGIAGIVTILFLGSIIVSGNFAWLNWLTLVLAFSTLDDSLLGWLRPLAPSALSPAPLLNGAAWGIALLVAFLSVAPIRNLWSRHQIMNTTYNPFHLVNSYGAFGSITRPRYEIVLEGTQDAVGTPAPHWLAYEFKGKPGDPGRRPPQVAPYHLRLDWLMWFAAMPSPYYPDWFVPLVGKLLTGDRPTLALLQKDPFSAAPPQQVRAQYYLYRFTTPEERRRTGCWWQRELVGTYFPPVSLADPAFRRLLEKTGWTERPPAVQAEERTSFSSRPTACGRPSESNRKGGRDADLRI